jgi:hypothetical protein
LYRTTSTSTTSKHVFNLPNTLNDRSATMTQPSAKKQKTSDTHTVTPMAPIIFKASDLKHDMQLKVFDQEFHVHSTMLKLHSAYFRKFLDSPEKPRATAWLRLSFDMTTFQFWTMMVNGVLNRYRW